MLDSPEDLTRFATEYLTVHNQLDPRLFGTDNKVREHLRLRLLDRAHYMANQTVGKIKGLEVKDVLLVGSSASYYYRSGSDFDVVIEVVNKNCPYLPKGDEELGKFLSFLTSRFYNYNKRFYVGNRFVDMKLTSYIINVAWKGVYSLKKNEWRFEPKQNQAFDFTVETLIEAFHRRCQELDDFIASLPQTDGKYDAEACKKMFDFYREQVLWRNNTVEDYLTFKMIKSTKKLKEFGAFIFKQQHNLFEF